VRVALGCALAEKRAPRCAGRTVHVPSPLVSSVWSQVPWPEHSPGQLAWEQSKLVAKSVALQRQAPERPSHVPRPLQKAQLVERCV